MSFVSPRVRAGSDVPIVHAANAVYALNEVRARRGALVAAGVLWGRVVRVREVVPVGASRVREVGVLVGGIGPGAFRTVKAWNEAVDAFAPVLVRDFYGLFVYEVSDDPRRLGRPLGASHDAVAAAVLAEE